MVFKLNTKAKRDTGLALIGVILYAFLLNYFDSFEVLANFTRMHEDWELDELILALLISPIFISWIAFRRWREAVHEIELRKIREKELIDIKELLEHRTEHDTLTGLPNRRSLHARLHQIVANCKRHGHNAALLFIDLDNFKSINDSLGHNIGDGLLKEVGRRLKIELRQEDFSARLAGDEFVVLFPELSDNKEQATRLAQQGAEKIQIALSEPYEIHGHRLYVTSSVGITIIPEEDEEADSALKHADIAMYRAKKAGRNAICFFIPSMQRGLEERIKLQNDLHHALVREEFHLHFQPKAGVAGNIIGAEALLRWQHPDVGNIVPGSFIPVAEESGQIVEIGAWVLEKALSQLKHWEGMGPQFALLNLSVNVSPRQFRQDDFVTYVERTLATTGARPDRLTLELTESVLVENMEDTIRKIDSLKRLGIRFSIDDFGTGYSSLAYLKRLPVDELKIDRSFIRDIETDPSDANLVETIIIIAGHFGLDVVAEGVEKKEQLNFLLGKGCCHFQGYYFGHPQSIEDFSDLMHAKVTQI